MPRFLRDRVQPIRAGEKSGGTHAARRSGRRLRDRTTGLGNWWCPDREQECMARSLLFSVDLFLKIAFPKIGIKTPEGGARKNVRPPKSKPPPPISPPSSGAATGIHHTRAPSVSPL